MKKASTTETRQPERADIVDIYADPVAERARKRRRLLRIGLPIGGIGLIVGLLLGISLYTDAANRAGVLTLSSTRLRGLEELVALKVSAHLAPAEHAILLATQSRIGRGGATVRADLARAFATAVLSQLPQAANVLFADAAGNFQLVTRAGADTPGGIATKLIRVDPEGRSVEWVTWDRAGAVVTRSTDPADTYDARTTGWFTGARGASGVFWTGVHMFLPERVPGVTAAVRGPDDDSDVIGIDIRLDELISFLRNLSIGRTGRAYIVLGSGHMIAGPDPARIMSVRDGTAVPATIDESRDADLAAAWDHFRLEGPGSRIIEVSGRRLISIATPLSSGVGGWLLMMTVPEAEFSGFVAVNARRGMALSLFVLPLALGLVGLLVRQGVRADRAERAAAERAAALTRQAGGFARLAREAGGFDGAGRPPPALTEALTEVTGAHRAGLWYLPPGGHALRCLDSFESATGGHVAGQEIASQEAPLFVAALARGEEIDAPDVRRDARVASLMESTTSTRLFAVPVTRDGRTCGAVVLEGPRPDHASWDLARACAALVAMGAPDQAPADAATPRPMVPAADPPVDGQGLVPAALGPDGAEEAGGPRRVAALVLRLPDGLLAWHEGMAEQEAEAIQGVARALEEAAEAHGLPYARMLGCTVVAVAGLSDPSEAAILDGASRLADTAITLRERCLALLARENQPPPAFGLGLDVGRIHSARLGRGQGSVNLWGEALRSAEALAKSAPTGTIQVSEQVYRRLRLHFVFRPRGVFYRPGIGDASCYVMAGRA